MCCTLVFVGHFSQTDISGRPSKYFWLVELLLGEQVRLEMHSVVGFPCQVWLWEVRLGLDELWLGFPIYRKCSWAGHCEPSPLCWPPIRMAGVMCSKLTAQGRASELLSGAQLLCWALLRWSWNLLRCHWLSAMWQWGINAWTPLPPHLKGTPAQHPHCQRSSISSFSLSSFLSNSVKQRRTFGLDCRNCCIVLSF